MKIKHLFLSAFISLLTVSFTSCSSDDQGTIVKVPTLESINSRCFILNSGKSGSNNAGLAFYAPNKELGLVKDLYEVSNGVKMGDTGQSIIYQDGYIYIVLSGSKKLLKLDSEGKEVKSMSFSPEDSNPRYLAYAGGKIYVTLWSNKVVRIDANTFDKEAYVSVGVRPEEITVVNNKLFVANSGLTSNRGNSVSEIDLATFTVVKTHTVHMNPNCVTTANGDVFVISRGNYNDVKSSFQKISLADGTCTPLGKATHMGVYKNVVYVVDSYTDWNSESKLTTNTFYSYDTTTGKLNQTPFLKNIPEVLKSTSIYMFEVSSVDGSIYIGTSDYKTNGDIYRFDAQGNFVEKFDCGGINPIEAVFFTKK